ncbi:IclR family transcriptional regulator [Beijerinckia indica]|uniref:Transcriptional regulator, IclR family n=1 Tax=Beijerinckia indica subsp. indica (strain ATCC 9039 / DSM 1715 / NCIMB 8712) TaxID=395963 RepID=B2IKG2_BEII9|nr:IclR family transcriptional regulator [Beijerinckia indica]ACB96442.1 transcriptional regulator, IclR family [Beijerinckia indica subsp. indica ATCC 9039]
MTNAVDKQNDMSSPITKALHLLDIVASFERPARFSEIQQIAGLSKATLHRLLKQLEAERMLSFDEEAQRYHLGLRLIRLAHGAWETASLAAVARPMLDRLAEKLGLTIHLGCLEGDQVLYLDKRTAKSSVRMFSSPGRVAPLHCTGLGKAMLAYLDAKQKDTIVGRLSMKPFTDKTITKRQDLLKNLAEIRRVGFAIDDQEHEPSIICLAVPILGRNGAMIGALSTTSTTYQHDLEGLKAFYEDLHGAAQTIARDAEVQFLAQKQSGPR